MMDAIVNEWWRLFDLYRNHQYAPIVVSILLVLVVRIFVRRFMPQWGAEELGGRGRVRIVTLAVYPVKSCAGVAVQRWKLGKRGLIDDRHWMVVDETGRFISQREQPRLALVQPAYSDDFQTLILSSPSCPAPLRIDRKAPPSGAQVNVTLWDDELSAREESTECNVWFAQAIGVPAARLVRIAPEHRRTLDARHAASPTADGAIAFPDSAPFLVLSRQSLAELERQLPDNRKRCADLRRFRPNIVVDGAHAPHEEDLWSKIAIGPGTGDAPVVLHAAKQCTRCRLTTCDPDLGVAGGDGEEPLSTLRRYRAPVTEDGGRSLVPVFGLHFLHDWKKDTGKTIGVGDVVVPLVTRTPEELAPARPPRAK